MDDEKPETTTETGAETGKNLIALWFGRVQQSARLMCGVPDYDTYLAHMRNKHPDKAAMTYVEFFNERQDARFGSVTNYRCC